MNTKLKSIQSIAIALVMICTLSAAAENITGNYPDWNNVRSDLSQLHPLLLKKLKKAMCFIVTEGAKEHTAIIVRASLSEFRRPVNNETPIRLHVDFYAGKEADLFAVYPVIYDDPRDPFFKETWLSPYDEVKGPPDPLSKEHRKMLRLLLKQDYAQTIVVDEKDKVMMVRKIIFTLEQKKTFERLVHKLNDYSGKTVSLNQFLSAVIEYLNKVPLSKLTRAFVSLVN